MSLPDRLAGLEPQAALAAEPVAHRFLQPVVRVVPMPGVHDAGVRVAALWTAHALLSHSVALAFRLSRLALSLRAFHHELGAMRCGLRRQRLGRKNRSGGGTRRNTLCWRRRIMPDPVCSARTPAFHAAEGGAGAATGGSGGAWWIAGLWSQCGPVGVQFVHSWSVSFRYWQAEALDCAFRATVLSVSCQPFLSTGSYSSCCVRLGQDTTRLGLRGRYFMQWHHGHPPFLFFMNSHGPFQRTC